MSINMSQDDHDATGSAPAAKKLRLRCSLHSLSGSSAAGRLIGSLWSFGEANACTLAGVNADILDVVDAMTAPGQLYFYNTLLADHVKAWAKN